MERFDPEVPLFDPVLTLIGSADDLGWGSNHSQEWRAWALRARTFRLPCLIVRNVLRFRVPLVGLDRGRARGPEGLAYVLLPFALGVPH